MAKCAVCTASPISTTWLWPLKCDHCSQITRWKFSQAEPRRWRALLISAWPCRLAANSCSQKAIDCVLVGLVQAVRLPDVLRALDDEGRGVVVELVDVGLEPAVLGLLEEEGEGVVRACFVPSQM